MPPDTSGVGGPARPASPRPASPSTIGPAAPVSTAAAVAPSTAIQPVVPVGPGVLRAPGSPLGRSGVDLRDLLTTNDVLVERSAGSAVALEVGLESARGSLLRQLPTDSLSALDAIWERAQLTEEGWYLRSGALTVLGLPGEAERVSTEGLERQPTSIALRFMQSISRLAAGDVASARSAIVSALDVATNQGLRHPVLLIQHALVSARSGHPGEAERTLQLAARAFPDHPAVDYGRETLKTIVADQTRSRSRETRGETHHGEMRDKSRRGEMVEMSSLMTGDQEVFELFGASAAREPERRLDARQPVADSETGCKTDDLPNVAEDVDGGNSAERAFARLGARFATMSTNDAVCEARTLIRAFSTGGSMSGTCTPEQAHAARTLLTAIVMQLTRSSAFVNVNANANAVISDSAASPLEALVAQWLPLTRDERVVDAERLLRRLGPMIPDAHRRLLFACTQRPADFNSLEDASVVTPRDRVEALVQGEVEKGPLIPVRLGLSLIQGRDADRSTDRVTARGEERGADPATIRPYARGDRTPMADVWTRTTPPRWERPVARVTPAGAALDARGWGAARLAAEATSPPAAHEGAGMRVAALLCVVAAALCATMGYGVLAIALGLGAAWLGLRRSGGSSGSTDRDGHLND